MSRSKNVFAILIFIFLLLIFSDIYLMFLNPLIQGVDIPNDYGDCIIVLGGGLRKGNKIGISTGERLNLAVSLYRKKHRKIIVSDGSLYKKSPAVNLIRSFLISLKVREEDIFLEGKSQTTFDNLVFTSEIIRKNNLNNIIVCTSPYHQKRTRKMIKFLKLKNYKIARMEISEIFSSDNIMQKFRNMKLVLKEYLSILKFTIKKS